MADKLHADHVEGGVRQPAVLHVAVDVADALALPCAAAQLALPQLPHCQHVGGEVQPRDLGLGVGSGQVAGAEAHAAANVEDGLRPMGVG